MANNLIQAAGAVQGTISGANSASVEAQVNCVNGVPTGTISGTADVFSGGPTTRRFSFFSESAVIVATLFGPQSLGAYFDNVSVQEDEFTPITGCQAYINATRLNANQWIGAFTVVSPNGLTLFFYGTFDGDILVNRQVFCQPLL